MKNEFVTAGAMLGAVALTALVGGLALAVYPGWDAVIKRLVSDSAPAWVQAVGSIVAIAAAAGIAVYQVDHARRLEEERRKASEIQRLSVVTALMARSYGLAKDVVTAFREPSDYHFNVVDTSLMRDTIETLRALPLFEIPSGMAAIDVRSTARYLSHLADNWDRLIEAVRESGNPPPEDDVLNIITFCEELMAITKEALDGCKKGIRARGGSWLQ